MTLKQIFNEPYLTYMANKVISQSLDDLKNKPNEQKEFAKFFLTEYDNILPDKLLDKLVETYENT